MELYQNAEMEIVKFSAEDVIATSSYDCENDTGVGDGDLW